MEFNQLLKALLAGKKPVYFETITFDDSVAVPLTIASLPTDADRPYFAIMALEADAEADAVKAAHFREDSGGAPTAAVGMPLGNGSVYELQGYDQILNFKIIGVAAGLTHKLQITYYKLGDQ